MDLVKLKTQFAGFLIIAGMIAGIFSIVPAIDSAEYLTEAAANSKLIIIGASFQFIMSLTYLGFGVLLYPIFKKFSSSLAIGFFSFRIITATLVIFGTILLLAILALSQEFIKNSPQSVLDFEALGSILKTTRDYINHVFMIFVLCAGNIMMYLLLIKSKLIPIWISAWGLFGALLSAISSVLVLFQIIEVITSQYIVLNMPTAILDLILGVWLIFKGFDIRVSTEKNN